MVFSTRNATRDGPRAAPARPALVALLAAVSLLAAGCAIPVQQVQVASCADRRVDVASSLYEDAKEQLVWHFQQRRVSALKIAYQTSRDAVTVARSVQSCFDFDGLSRSRALDLIRSNLLFQKLVKSNMRDQDPEVVIGLLGPQYQDVFKHDIQ